MKEKSCSQQLPYLGDCTPPENLKNHDAAVSWQKTKEPVSIPFCKDGNAVESKAWAVSMRCYIRVRETEQRTGCLTLCANHNNSNHACFWITRNLDGFNGICRYIRREGVRLQDEGDEIVMDSPAGENWHDRFDMLSP